MAAQPVNPRDAALPPPDANEIRVQISNEIQRPDAGARTADQLRRQVALNLGLDAAGLDGRKDEFLELTSSVTEDMGTALPRLHHVLLTSPESVSAQQHVYLVTFSRTLSQLQNSPHPVKDLATMSREGIAMAIKKAFDDPLPHGRGHPRAARPAGPGSSSALKFVVAFQEKHADGLSTVRWGSQLPCMSSNFGEHQETRSDIIVRKNGLTHEYVVELCWYPPRRVHSVSEAVCISTRS